MKRLLLIILILVILTLAATYQNNTNLRLIISNLIYKSGIKTGNLVYKVSLFNVFFVGQAIFNNQEEDFQGIKVYHLTANASPSTLVSKFYNTGVVLDSYLDIRDKNPLVFKQKISLPRKEETTKQVSYDQKHCIMTIDGIGRSILPNTQDPLSAMFNLRTMDFEKVKGFEMSINTNQKNYCMIGKVIPREISISGNKYKTFIVNAEIKRRDKNPYHRSSISVIFLKDKENIPVLIRVFSSGILINAKLVEIR